MIIESRQYLVLKFNLEKEYNLYSFHEGDMVMYRGDTYIVKEIETLTNFPYTIYVSLELFRRASNFLVIDMNDNLHKVADHNSNCMKEKRR